MENKNESKIEGFEEEHFNPPVEVQRADRLTRLLSSVQSGWKIAIMREQPSWCKGHLETLEVFDPTEEGAQVDVNYLIREWGGHRLFLKVHNERGQWVGGGSVSLFSYPPKVRSKLLREPDYSELLTPSPSQPPYPYPYQPAAAAPTLDFGRLLDIVMKQKNSDPATLLKLLELQQNAQQRQIISAPQQNPIEQLMGMMTLFREMKGMFGDMMGGGDGQSDESSMVSMIAEVVKGLVSKQAQGPQRRVLKSPSAQQTQPLPPTQSVAESNVETLSSIADKLATLGSSNPGDAAEVVLTALGNMPEPARSKAMTIFLTHMGEDDEELDDSSNIDDNSIDGSVNSQPQILPHGRPVRSTR